MQFFVLQLMLKLKINIIVKNNETSPRGKKTMSRRLQKEVVIENVYGILLGTKIRYCIIKIYYTQSAKFAV